MVVAGISTEINNSERLTAVVKTSFLLNPLNNIIAARNTINRAMYPWYTVFSLLGRFKLIDSSVGSETAGMLVSVETYWSLTASCLGKETEVSEPAKFSLVAPANDSEGTISAGSEVGWVGYCVIVGLGWMATCWTFGLPNIWTTKTPATPFMAALPVATPISL